MGIVLGAAFYFNLEGELWSGKLLLFPVFLLTGVALVAITANAIASAANLGTRCTKRISEFVHRRAPASVLLLRPGLSDRYAAGIVIRGEAEGGAKQGVLFEELLADAFGTIERLSGESEPSKPIRLLLRMCGFTMSRVTHIPSDKQTWKEIVEKHVEHSTIVLLILGDTPGLLVELDMVSRLRAQNSQTLFVFPVSISATQVLGGSVGTDDDVAARWRRGWDALKRVMDRDGATVPDLPFDVHPVVAAFSPKGTLRLVVSDHSAEISNSHSTRNLRRLLPPAVRRCVW